MLAGDTSKGDGVWCIKSRDIGLGTESLENPHIFQTPEVKSAGGLGALQTAGIPAELVRETKVRMIAT